MTTSQLDRTLSNIEEDVREQIGKHDPKMPMDSSPYESSRKEITEKNKSNSADCHVVKVTGLLELVMKMTNHESNQGKCAGLFFVRLLKKENECELEAIRMHASKTTEEGQELQDMYLVFLPGCFTRPTFMKVLPHLDMNTLHEDLDAIGGKLWDLPIELQGDCIVSGVAPDHPRHPIKQSGIGIERVTLHYQWTQKEGWTKKMQRGRRCPKSKAPPKGPPCGMPWEWQYPLPMYGDQLGAYGMPGMPSSQSWPHYSVDFGPWTGSWEAQPYYDSRPLCNPSSPSLPQEPMLPKQQPLVISDGGYGGQVLSYELQTMQGIASDSTCASEVNAVGFSNLEETEGQDDVLSLPEVEPKKVPFKIKNTFIDDIDNEEDEENKAKPNRSAPAKLGPLKV